MKHITPEVGEMIFLMWSGWTLHAASCPYQWEFKDKLEKLNPGILKECARQAASCMLETGRR